MSTTSQAAAGQSHLQAVAPLFVPTNFYGISPFFGFNFRNKLSMFPTPRARARGLLSAMAGQLVAGMARSQSRRIRLRGRREEPGVQRAHGGATSTRRLVELVCFVYRRSVQKKKVSATQDYSFMATRMRRPSKSTAVR